MANHSQCLGRSVFRLGLLATAALCTTGGDRARGAQDGPARELVPWNQYLHDRATEIGCHYTLEEVAWWVGNDPGRWRQLVNHDQNVKGLDDLIAKLSLEVRGFRFVKDQRRKNILHVIERELIDLKGYALDAKVDVDFAGVIDDLGWLLHDRLKCIAPRTHDDWRDSFNDGWSEVAVHAKQRVVRDIITDSVPADSYGAPLWRTRTWLDQEVPKTIMQYYGLKEFRLGPASNWPWWYYLEFVGKKLGCFFTIETLFREGDDPKACPVFVPEDKEFNSIEDLSQFFKKKIPWLVFRRNELYPNIVHVIDSDLLKLDGYALEKLVDVKLEGTPDGLCRALRELTGNLAPRTFERTKAYDLPREDRKTRLSVDAKQQKIREILTFEPTADYEGRLWRARTRLTDGGPETTVEYYGEEPDPKTLEEWSWNHYLELVGKRLGCHFTIEVVSFRKLDDLKRTDPTFRDDDDIKTVDALIKKVSGALPGFSFIKNASHPNVVHVIEDELLMLDDYAIEKKATVAFTGTIDRLSRELKKQVSNIGPKEAGFSREVFDDGVTDIEVDADDQRIRDTLTDCVPLESYRAVLWRAETRKVKGGSVTTVQFYGPVE